MSKMNLDRQQLDHPEHFDDEIREYRESTRVRPTPLEQMLFELAGHCCTICKAPWLEIHHIHELAEGGQTTYENLIVLCPNCHTRVHQTGIPSKEELRHYKLKQEVAFELPVLSRLSAAECQLLKDVAGFTLEDQVAFSKQRHDEVEATSGEEAVRLCRRTLGLVHLQESGIVSVEEGFIIGLANGTHMSVSLNIRLTGKGVKWLRYLVATDRVPKLAKGIAQV